MKSEYTDKLVRKLLSTEQGRKALSAQLGGAQIKPRGEVEQKPIVATLTPCYSHPEPAMTESYVNMCEASREHCVVYNGTTIRDSSVVHWSRNQLIANLIKSQKPWTHVLFIDDDIVLPPDTLIKLLGHEKDIIGAVCTRRADPPIPNIRYFEEESGNFREIFEWTNDGLLEVGAVGTGVMLITREALQKVAEVYFTCQYEREVWRSPEDRVKEIEKYRREKFDETADAWWFKFGDHILTGAGEYGEDITFCLKARRYAGLKVYVDTTNRPGHLGLYPYSIEDFFPYREQVLAKAKAEGRFKQAEEQILVTA